MPKQINTHIPGQQLVRRFGLKGRYQPVLDETIVPVVQVAESQTVVKPCSALIPISVAAAGKNFYIKIVNPALSGLRVTFLGHSILAGANTGIWYGFGTWSIVGAVAVVPVPSFVDTALAGVPAALIQAGAQTTATLANATAIWYNRAAAFGNRNPADQVRFYLKEGTQLTIWFNTANVEMTEAGLLWTEETLNPTAI